MRRLEIKESLRSSPSHPTILWFWENQGLAWAHTDNLRPWKELSPRDGRADFLGVSGEWELLLQEWSPSPLQFVPSENFNSWAHIRTLCVHSWSWLCASLWSVLGRTGKVGKAHTAGHKVVKNRRNPPNPAGSWRRCSHSSAAAPGSL